MSVYIKGMEMPKGCAFCKISRRNGKKMICPFIWQREWDIHDPMSADHRLDGCPLIPVSDHGRLIDGDELIDELPNNLGIRGLEYLNRQESAIVSWIRGAPTIIPADGGDAE